jgi:DNA polymerase-1
VRALVGDSTDNIPGVKGIGEKGAAKLIQEFGSLEALLARAGEVTAKRAREALATQADAARLSKELATLRTDAPGCDEPARLALRPPDVATLRALYTRLELRRVLEALDAETGAPAGAKGGRPAARRAPSAQGAFGFDAPAAAAVAEGAAEEAAADDDLAAAERARAAAASAVPAAALADRDPRRARRRQDRARPAGA